MVWWLFGAIFAVATIASHWGKGLASGSTDDRGADVPPGAWTFVLACMALICIVIASANTWAYGWRMFMYKG